MNAALPFPSSREMHHQRLCVKQIMRNEEYTTKADAYSMGILLWELLTRQQKFFSEVKLASLLFSALLHQPSHPHPPIFNRSSSWSIWKIGFSLATARSSPRTALLPTGN